MTKPLKKIDSIIPNNKDIELAKQSSRTLAGLLNKKAKTFDLELSDSNGTKKIVLPAYAIKILSDILTQMSLGNAVTIVPLHAELTTQEAAEILNVSRPFIIKLLEDGKISYKMVGTRRKILFKNLMLYKETMYHARLKTLDELSKDAQDLDIGY
jgi:excisionase family DNA binding protein